MKKRLLRYAAPFFLGALAALPLAIREIALLSFFLWSPFAYYAKTALTKEGIKLRHVYLRALFFFQGYFTVAFSFFWAMYPLDFAGLETAASIAVLLAATILLPLLQAFFAAFPMVLLAFMGKKKMFFFPLSYALSFASLVTLAFYLQNFTWMGVPWASPAVPLASTPILAQSASLFGSPFLCFLILLCNALLSEVLDLLRDDKDRQARFALIVALSLFFSNLTFGAIYLQKKPEGEAIKIAILQGNSPIKDEPSSRVLFDRYFSLAEEAAAAGDVDLMLWPESILHHALENDERRKEYFSDIAIITGATQIVGAFSAPENEEDTGGYYNSLFVFLPNGSIHETVYHKQRPVPFGEYLPWPQLFSTLIPALAEINMLSRDTDPGKDSTVFVLPEGNIGALICFDSIYPSLARGSVQNGAELILLSTNDTWFDGSFGKALHLSHAKLRAIETGRTVVRSANTGFSAVIDIHGRPVSEIPEDEAGYVTASVILTNEATLYSVLGDAFVYLLPLYLISLPILYIFTCKKRKERAL